MIGERRAEGEEGVQDTCSCNSPSESNSWQLPCWPRGKESALQCTGWGLILVRDLGPCTQLLSLRATTRVRAPCGQDPARCMEDPTCCKEDPVQPKKSNPGEFCFQESVFPVGYMIARKVTIQSNCTVLDLTSDHLHGKALMVFEGKML